MMRETPSEVLEGWKAAYAVEPWGDDWWQAGMIAAAAVNPHIKKPMSAQDFMPNRKLSAGITDLEEMERAMAAMAGMGVA
jgi:hypothetical protein